MKEEKKELKSKKKEVKKERKELKKLGVEGTWNTFIQGIEQQAKQGPAHYLFTYILHLEKRLRQLYAEIHLSDAERISFEKELSNLKENLNIENILNLSHADIKEGSTNEKALIIYTRELERRLRDSYTDKLLSEQKEKIQ